MCNSIQFSCISISKKKCGERKSNFFHVLELNTSIWECVNFIVTHYRQLFSYFSFFTCTWKKFQKFRPCFFSLAPLHVFLCCVGWDSGAKSTKKLHYAKHTCDEKFNCFLSLSVRTQSEKKSSAIERKRGESKKSAGVAHKTRTKYKHNNSIQ